MVVKEILRRVTLSDLVEDASKSIDAYKKNKINGMVLFRRLNIDSLRCAVRLMADTTTVLGIGAVANDMNPSYLLYGTTATAVTYAVDYFVFEKYSGKPL